MKLKPLFLLLIFLFFAQKVSFAQNYKDVSLIDPVSSTCPPTNGFAAQFLIHPNSGTSGKGIGWGANLYLASEAGGANTIYDLTWIIGTNTTYAGYTYYFNNVDIWMYEYTGSQFPNDNRPAVETWTASASTPTDVTNVVKVISNGTLTVKDPGSGECIASTLNNLDIPYNYSGNNSLIIYIQRKTNATNSAGSNLAYPVFKHNTLSNTSTRRRICNWEGTLASPLPPTSNTTANYKFARVVFNRVLTNSFVKATCSAGNITSCLPSCVTAGPSTTVTICGPTTYSLVNSVTSNTTATWVAAAGSPTLTGGYRGVFTTTNTGAYSYTYNIPASGACPTSSAVVTVSVLPKPAGTGTNVSICAGSTYSLFPLLNAGSTSGTWSPTVGLSGGYMGVITPTASGSYTYKVSNSACNTFTSAVVTVSLPPNPAGTNATYTLCSAASTPTLYNVLNAKDPSGTWTPPNPSLSSGYLGVFSHSVEGVYTYTYTVLTPSVCPLMPSSSAVATVSVFPNPSAILTATNPACGKTNGVLSISNTSGLGQTVTNFASSSGTLTGQIVTGLGPGTFTVTLTNNFGCKFTAVETLTNSSGPTDFSLTPTHATCTNDNGELAFSSPVGGTAPYTYSVNGIAKTSPNSLLSAGTYTVKLEDASGCTFTKTTTLFNRKPTAIAGTTSSASCASPDGSYTITSVTDNGLSVSNYSFTMDGGTATTNTVFTNLASGIHTLSVINASATACPYTTTISIGTRNTMTVTTINVKDAACGLSNGSATVAAVSGGVAPYQYSYNGGNYYTTTADTAKLPVGNYTVFVKDNNACASTGTFTIKNTGTFTANIVSTSSVTCHGGANGSFTLNSSSSAGAGTITYSMVIGGVANTRTATVGSAVSFTNVSAGTYNVFVIEDQSGCSVPLSVSVSQPTAALSVLGIGGDTFTTTCHPDNVGSNANLILTTFSVTGSGANTYSYNINGGTIAGVSGGTLQINSGQFQTSNVFSGVPVGDYVLRVDGLGCLTTATTMIHVVSPPTIALSSSTLTAKCTPSASGGATITATGGNGGYTYAWTPSGQTSSVLSNVAAGTYTVLVKDSKSCEQNRIVSINSHSTGVAVITSSTAVTCKGSSTGKLSADMQANSGGTAPFTYLWSPGGQTIKDAVNLSAGNYTCTITDFNGCPAVVTTTLSEATASLTVPAANAGSNPVKCHGGNGGTIFAIADGGVKKQVPPFYDYQWTTTRNGAVVNLGTVATISNTNIIAGTYTCTITDSTKCTFTQTISVSEPLPIALTSSVTPAGCNQADGVVSYTASGGTPNYYYSFEGAAFSSSITSTQSLTVGSYSITVKDDNACEETFKVTVGNPNSPVLSVASQSNISCFGKNDGVISLSVAPTTNTYSYAWSASSTQSTSIGTNLPGGIITVTVTDVASTCKSVGTYTINEPAKLEVMITGTVNPKCYGDKNGFGYASAQGGTPSYTYAWTTNTLTVVNAGNIPVSSGTVGAGIHYVTVTDAHQCVTTQSMELINPDPVSVSITTQSVTCYGLATASAVATATNGTTPYTYSWISGLLPSAVNSATLSNVKAGTYTITATDKNGCIGQNQSIILEPVKLTGTIASTGSVTCNAGNNGYIDVTPGGGTGAYTYTWLPNGGNSPIAQNLTAGNYTLTIGDANGCKEKVTANVAQPAALTTSVSIVSNVKCKGDCDAIANIAYSGGTGTPQFTWLPGLQTGNFVNNLCAGVHTVMISTNTGSCSSYITINITDPPAVLTLTTNVSNANCQQADGSASVLTGGGVAPYTYLWSNGSTTANMNNVKANTYTVAVTDARGCTKVVPASINDIQGPKIVVVDTIHVTCFGKNDGAATVTVTPGASPPPFNISWSDGHRTLNVTDFTSGLKILTLVDQVGCKATAAVDIREPKKLISTILTPTNVTCFGGSDGAAEVLVADGTAPYTFSWTPSGQVSQLAINIPADTHTAIVKDKNGCISSTTIKINQPTELRLISPIISNITCFGKDDGFIVAPFQGGNQPYTYNWSPGTFVNANTISGLPPSTYSLNLVDSKNCHKDTTFLIIEPSLLTSTYVSKPATCGLANGSATINISGGTPTFSVYWNLPGLPTGSVAINMPPGNNWTANIRDSKGCLATQTLNIAKPPVPIILSTSATDPTCFGGADGTMSVTFGSGTAPYSVIWPSPLSQTVTPNTFTEQVSGVVAGTHNVTVQDVYGCQAVKPILVSQPSEVTLIVTQDTKICYGRSIQISANASGGSTPYTYIWNPNTYTGTGPHSVSPKTVASYSVMAMDSKGCTSTSAQKVITIDVSAPLEALGNSVTICHAKSAILTPSISSLGNGGPYTYVGYPSGVITYTGTALIAQTTNTLGVTVTDGCTIPNSMAIFTIVTNPLPTANFVANKLEACVPSAIDFSVTSTSAGAFTYTWTTDNNELMGNTSSTTYTFTSPGSYLVNLGLTNSVTGCLNNITKSNYILINDKPKALFTANPEETSVLDPIVNFINKSQDAVSYYWDFGDGFAIPSTNTSTLTNSTHVYSEVGEYKVHLVATSAKGCKDTANFVLEIKPDFVIYIPNSFTPDGNGLNETFQPVGIGIDEENYRMDIFDRWGENIFSSVKFREGWDGKVKGGKIAPQGTYIYKILVVDYKGNKHPYIGHINVMSEN